MYFDYYRPLIRDFIREVDSWPVRDKDRLPGPFLPRYGEFYEASPTKLVIVGQDDANSWNLWRFIEGEKAEPGAIIRKELEIFQSRRPIIEGSGSRNTFWGFTMMLLAALHGRKNDWEKMKRGEMREILGSFGWGNIHSIALPASLAACTPPVVLPSYWGKVRQAGERFNGFSHIQKTLNPRVVVVMCKNKDFSIDAYLKGYRPEQVLKEEYLSHYRLPEAEVDVFHIPHPVNMKFNEKADYFCDRLTELFKQQGYKF